MITEKSEVKHSYVQIIKSEKGFPSLKNKTNALELHKLNLHCKYF
jgi:hypothetical protein